MPEHVVSGGGGVELPVSPPQPFKNIGKATATQQAAICMFGDEGKQLSQQIVTHTKSPA